MKNRNENQKPEPDDKATDSNTYTKMLFAIRAIRVIVMDLQDRKPKVDDYTANGLLNIEKWAEFGLDPNGEKLVREWAETASNLKGEEDKD